MHPKKPKGLSLGLGFQFFEYLGLGTNKNLKFLGMDLSINFDFFSIFLNLYPKILNYLIPNLQKIRTEINFK